MEETWGQGQSYSKDLALLHLQANCMTQPHVPTPIPLGLSVLICKMKDGTGWELPEKPCQLHFAVISILRNSLLLAASRLRLVLHFRVHDTELNL